MDKANIGKKKITIKSAYASYYFRGGSGFKERHQSILKPNQSK